MSAQRDLPGRLRGDRCPIVYCGGHSLPLESGASLAEEVGGPEIVLPTPARTRRWTADELAELRRLALGARVDEIALTLGRTPQAIRTKAAQKRISLQGDAPTQGPPRMRLPWENDRKPT